MIQISEERLASIIAEAIVKAKGNAGKEKKEAPAKKDNPYAGEACKRIRNEALKIKWGINAGKNKRIAKQLASKYGVVEATANAQVSRALRYIGSPVPAGIVDNWSK